MCCVLNLKTINNQLLTLTDWQGGIYQQHKGHLWFHLNNFSAWIIMAETSRWTRVRMVSVSFAASRVNDWIVLEQPDAWPWEMLKLNVSSEFSSFWDFCQYSNCLSQVGLPLVVISALMKCSKSRHCCLVFNFNGGIAVFVKTFHIYLTRMTGVEVFCTPKRKIYKTFT